MEPLHNNRRLSQSPLFKFLLLEFICLILMVSDKNHAIGQPIRNALSYIALPLIKTIEWPQNIYQSAELALSRQQSLVDENTKLKQQLIDAQLKVQQNTTLSAENERLRTLLNAAKELPLSTSVAFVSNVDLHQKRQHIIINQGATDGVFVGQAVIGLSGVIGQVDVLEAHTAHVIMITDSAHVVPVEILRTGMRTLAYGQGNDLLLNEIPISVDIKKGDVLVTSGFGNRYPRGLKIAEVKELSLSDNRMFQRTTAEPFVSFEQLTEVFLVWPSEATTPVLQHINQSDGDAETVETQSIDVNADGSSEESSNE